MSGALPVAALDKDATIQPRRRSGCLITNHVACLCAVCYTPIDLTHINAGDLRLTCADCCPICRRESV